MTSFLLKTTEFINLELTLFSGQIFSFKKTAPNSYSGVISNQIITFHQVDNQVYYDYPHEIQKDLELFFTLDIEYESLFKDWKEFYFDFKYSGLRLLRCDLFECIFTFICSSNNTVKRITKMVNHLFSKGTFLGSLGEERFFSFPKLSSLQDKEDLLENKFGYRSNYICKTAQMLLNEFGDQKDIRVIKKKCLEKKFLTSLSGIGNKVSDCIKLMALDQFDVVPIDTHIFKALKNIFGETKKLTNQNYFNLQSKFQNLFGKYSGIAQLYIFKEFLDKRNKI